MDFSTIFVSIGSVVAAVLTITEFIDSKLFPGKLTKLHTQILSWALSIIMAIGASFLGWGMFLGMVWWMAGIFGVGIGLVANGIFDINMVQAVLEFIKLKVPTEQKALNK